MMSLHHWLRLTATSNLKLLPPSIFIYKEFELIDMLSMGTQ